MRKCLFVLLLLVLIATAVLPIASAKPPTTMKEEAEMHILNQLRRANIPNAAIATIQDGETSYILKDSTHDTLFQIGSVSKSFTAFAVLLLEDMGLLSVDDPVNQHLPWFEVRYNGMSVPHEDIRIYNLLHHTSGLTSNERRFPDVTAGVVADDIASQIRGVELAFYPSTEFAYGNINYVILGLLIEAVSGQSYQAFMTEQVLHPLGLYNTFTDPQHAHETGRVIGGNRLGFLQARSHNLPATLLAVPTGYIYSGISDMVRWAGIHLGTVELSEQFARLVQRSHENHHSSENPFADSEFFYAAGWFVHSERGEIEHGGQTSGYSTLVSFFPDDNIAVVALGNLVLASIMHPFGALALDNIGGYSFDVIGMDLYIIMDIALTIITALGLVFVGLFVRLLIRLSNRFRKGERIKTNFTAKIMIQLVAAVMSLALLIAFYIVPPLVFDTSRAVVVAFAPASLTTGGIALWIITAYAWCSWLAKVFVHPCHEK